MTAARSAGERPLRVLLVEPFAAGSRRAWAEGQRAHSRHEVTVVSLPGRFWRWRLRGGAVALAEAVAVHVATHGRPDVVLVASMVDLAALLGLARRALGDAPVVAYMHENQLAYPRADAGDVDAALRTWVSLRAADRVVFNSAHHLEAVCRALPGLAAWMPDGDHDLDPAWLRDRSTIVPVGVDVDDLAARRRRRSPHPGEVPLVVWNHRWDDDKDPDGFVRAMRRLSDAGVPHRVALLGVDDWEGEPRRARAVTALGGRVEVAATLPVDEYRDVLARADVVVSAAHHEFFGVAVVEAVAAGCVPLLPDRVGYPEIVPPAHHGAVLYGDGELGGRLRAVVSDVAAARRAVAGLPEAMGRFAWPVVARRLDAVLEATVTSPP